MTAGVEQISKLIEPTVQALGLELWGVEYLIQGRNSVLRIYIENMESGVSIDDCADVSRQVSAILDVEDPIAGEYTLEVSSPGVDRPLFRPEQYTLYIGSKLNLRLRTALQGRKKFTGVLENVTGNEISLLVDGEPVVLPFSQIDKASIAF